MGFTRTRTTRLAGAVSLIGLALVTLSDYLITDFWDHNAMLTSVVADVFVLIVGVAVVNEVLAARSRRQWQLVADYALVELSRSSRRVWVQLAEAIGVGKRKDLTRDQLRHVVISDSGNRRTDSLAEAAACSAELRRRLHAVTSGLVPEVRRSLMGWAPVLLQTPESGALSRFVELHALLSGLDLVLREEAEGWQPTTEGTGNPDWIAARITSLISLGSELEGALLASAHRISRELGLDEGV